LFVIGAWTPGKQPLRWVPVICMTMASATSAQVFTSARAFGAQSPPHRKNTSFPAMQEREPTKPPYNSGYPEQRPEPADQHQQAPDAQSPHEPHNVPAKKPYPSSSPSG
jgi:hypothetical protein